MSQSILTKIVIQRKIDVEEARKKVTLEELIKKIPDSPPVINFLNRLKIAFSSDNTVAVIGEIKRASPSKGDIDINVNAPQQGLDYGLGGASGISVLTEPTWFKGTLDDLQQVRKNVDQLGETRPGLLRKDFIIDPYQVYEARVYGADSILLIVAILTDEEISSLMQLSRSLGMEPLVEVNNTEEMKRAIALGSKLIGVNNRNLHTFDVNMNTTTQLASLVPDDVILAALSGISSRSDVEHFESSGAKVVLVGESLMKSQDKKSFIQHLLGKN